MHVRFEPLALPIIALAVALLDVGASGGAWSVNGRAIREACPRLPTAVCFQDSAYYREYPSDPYGMPRQDWIIFGNAGDPVDLLAGAEAAIQTNLGVDHLANRNDAPYFRRRLRRDGVVAANVLIDVNSDTDPYPYWFRVARQPSAPNASLTLTGGRATVKAGSWLHRRDSFSIVPLSMVSRVKDLSSWKVRAGTWVVALVKDSLYDVCYKRCVRHDTIRLRPFQRVAIAK
jgi:hypothetical protein